MKSNLLSRTCLVQTLYKGRAIPHRSGPWSTIGDTGDPVGGQSGHSGITFPRTFAECQSAHHIPRSAHLGRAQLHQQLFMRTYSIGEPFLELGLVAEVSIAPDQFRVDRNNDDSTFEKCLHIYD